MALDASRRRRADAFHATALCCGRITYAVRPGALSVSTAVRACTSFE